MNQCFEFIYDRSTLEFYPETAIQFSAPLMEIEKAVPADKCIIIEENKYLSVGNFPQHSTTQLRANDSAEEVTTSVSEEKENENYLVKIHFEVKNPTPTTISLIDALDFQPFHVVIVNKSLDNTTTSRRVIRNGQGQFRSRITDNTGIIHVDMDIVNTNGIQLITPTT